MNTYVASEPLFYGPDDSRGLNITDFVTRFDALATAGEWNDARKAAQLRAFLRGSAFTWLDDTVPLTRGDLGWEDLYTFFKSTYQPHTHTADISADWASVRQRHGETALSFFNRVTQVVNARRKVSRRPAPTAAEVTTCFETIPEHAGLTAPEARAVRAAITTVYTNAVNAAFQMTHQDLAITIFANGLNTPKLQELVKTEQRKNTTLADIATLVFQAERNMTRQPRPPVNNNGHKSSNGNNGRSNGHKNGVHAVDDEDNQEDDNNDVDATAFGKGNSKKGKGKPRGKDKDENGRAKLVFNKDKQPLCKHCPGKVFHWHAVCPNNPKLKANAANHHPAEADANTYDIQPYPNY